MEKKKIVTITLEERVVDFAKKKAESQGRSLSNFINQLVISKYKKESEKGE